MDALDQVRTNRFRSFVVMLVLVVAGSLGSGMLLGYKITSRDLAAQQRVVDERVKRIEAFIVERNPDATIKDFADFPRILLAESEAAGIDYRLIIALIDKESSFNPKAVGSSGEVGLMQIMPATARLMVGSNAVLARLGGTYQDPGKRRPDGKYGELGTLADPRANIIIGIAFLKERMDKFSSPATALRAYNRGDAKATEVRPHDRYAEDIAFKFLVLAQELPK